VTENEALVLRNLLNGVDPVRAAAAGGLPEAEGLAVFHEAMRRVQEYVLVHCVPFFPCAALSEARQNRALVMEVLGAIQRWDDGEREIAIAILRGRKVVAEGVPRAQAEAVLDRVLTALPHYLTAADIALYARNRAVFVRDQRARVLDAVEKFVSFREPLLYRRIVHTTGGAETLLAHIEESAA